MCTNVQFVEMKISAETGHLRLVSRQSVLHSQELTAQDENEISRRADPSFEELCEGSSR